MVCISNYKEDSIYLKNIFYEVIKRKVYSEDKILKQVYIDVVIKRKP